MIVKDIHALICMYIWGDGRKVLLELDGRYGLDSEARNDIRAESGVVEILEG